LSARNKRCRKTVLLWEGILGTTCTVLYCEKGSELVFFFMLSVEVLKITFEYIKDKMMKCSEEQCI